jgi:hypothetical protein
VKYIFIRKKKIVLFPKLRKNQREVAISALRGLLYFISLLGGFHSHFYIWVHNGLDQFYKHLRKPCTLTLHI